MDSIKKLEEMVKKYKESHPRSQNPYDYLFAYGHKGLIELLEEAGGRRIIFKDEEGIDNCSHRFTKMKV